VLEKVWSRGNLPTLFEKINASQFFLNQFTTAEMCKQPKCLSTKECIKKILYIYAMEYNLSIKKKESMPLCSNKN